MTHRVENTRPTHSWLIVLAIGLAVATTLVGVRLTLSMMRERPNRDATLAGIYLHVDHAEWLEDQMEKHEQFPMPANMMPDLPPHGVFRLNVEVALQNPSRRMQTFEARELFLRASEKGMWPATGADVAEGVQLGPSQLYNMYAHFDIAEAEIKGELQLLWVRGGKTVQMIPIPHPPDHFHDEETSTVEWPETVTALPDGRIANGERLYATAHGCLSCHGHPDVANSHTVGPHLSGIGTAAAGRVGATSAPQYLYESILEPDRFIAPDCKHAPCASPSAMPPYGELLQLQDMADLVAYLLSL